MVISVRIFLMLMLYYYVRIWFKKIFLVSIMNAISESISVNQNKWENFCDNSSLNHFYFYCLLIGAFNSFY